MAPPASSSPLQTVPHPRTRLIGRQTELAAAHALLLDEAVPLLTLTGPGGIGKTRLALAIAHDLIDHFADGVAFVDLAVIADGALVPGAVGRVLGTAVETGPDPDEQLAAFCRPRQLLLVLDNCEHLIESVAALTSRLLAACPALQVLATSRAPLHLHVEHELPVPTLLRGADAADAVALFVERARMVRPGFRLDATTEPVLAAICRQLDGLPLAIELAASWIRLLLPGPLLARLSDRVLELTGEARDLPARQQTLREAIAWSHDLLSDGEQVLFWRLGVFAGGFDLDAASAVAAVAGGPDGDVLAGLAALMYQSLVQRAEGGKAPRFAMLETIRSFAVERLEASGELAAVREAHARYFLGLAEATAPHLEGPEQATWLDQLDRDHANLRAALGWVQERGDAGTGLRLAGALGLFWFMRGDLAEGRSWLSTVLAMPAATEPAIRAKALNAAALLARYQGDYVAAAFLIEETLAIQRARGDEQGLADVLSNLGYVRLNQGAHATAREHYEQALAINRARGNSQGVADDLSHLAIIALETGDSALARRLHAESLALWRALGDRQGEAWALCRLGMAILVQGDLVDAGALFEDSLRIARDIAFHWGIAESLEGLAALAVVSEALERALYLAGAAAAVREERGIAFSSASQADLVRRVEAAGRSLPAEVAAAASAAGRALPLPQVLDEALARSAATAPQGPGTTVVPGRAGPLDLPPGSDLTHREREILGYLCQRLTDPEIGELLFISPRTASKHVGNVLGKLGVSSRREAAALAARQGLV